MPMPPAHSPQPTTRLARLMRLAWRIVAWPETAIIVVGLLFAATLLGGVLPQMARDLAPGSSAHAFWLSQAHARWGALADAFSALGLAQIYSGRAFRVLGALLFVLVALWALRLWLPAWAALPRKLTTHPVALPDAPAPAWDRLITVLRAAGLRPARQVDLGGARYALAGRFGLGRWLPGAVLVGALTLLAAAVVGGQFGWSGPSLDLALGETQLLDRSQSLAARLDQIELYPRADGSLQRFDSRLLLSRGAKPEKVIALGPGRHASYDGTSIYQTGYGPAARVSARDAQGGALDLYGLTTNIPRGQVVRVRFDERQQEQLLHLPDRDLVIRLVHYPSLPAQGIRGRALHAQLLQGRDSQLVAEQFLAASGTIGSAEVSVDIGFEYYVTLRAEREPELPLVACGAGLMLAGLAATLVWPPRNLWIALTPDGERSVGQLTAARSLAEAAWFQRIVAQWPQTQANEEGHD